MLLINRKKEYLLSILTSISMFNFFGHNKKESENKLYKFKDSENTPSFVCNHVLSKERPILYVSHDGDADWQFLCGHDDHTEENAKIISLKEVTELDPTVNKLYEMPINVGVIRETIQDKWQPFKLQ